MTDANFDPYHVWLGIPPEEQPANHYRLMGLELFEEDRDVIETVSLEQIAHIRTYAIGANSELSQSLLNEISDARLTLLNPVQKADYDQELRQRLTATSLVRPSSTAENPEAVPAVTDGASEQLPRKPQRRLSRSFNEVNASPSDSAEKRTRYIRIGGAGVLGFLVFVGLLFFIRVRSVSREIGIALNRGDYVRVLELDPDNPEALSRQQSVSNLADALAQKDYKRALSIDPYNAKALMLKREDLLGALLARDYVKALDIDPDNAKALRQQKEAAAQQAVANGDFRQALELDPTNREALALKSSALAIEKAAEIEAALKAGDYMRALRLDRTNPEALAMKQSVERKHGVAVGNNPVGSTVDSANTDPLVMKKEDKLPPPAIAPFDAAKAKEHQDAWAKFLGVEVEIENSIGMKLRVIPSGTFIMGEGDQVHEVTLTKPFKMGVHEVTQEHYEQVMGVNPSKYKGADNPVEFVSWEDAVEFCRRLSELPAEKVAGNVYRLPTEAEWEYACRAGTTTKFSFGDDESELRDYAWFNGNSDFKTHAVVGKQPNAWGIHNMHGNVHEWCQDWYGDYPDRAVTDPTGADAGSRRIYRGGAWPFLAEFCVSAVRKWSLPSLRYRNLGFRVSLSASSKQIDASTDVASMVPKRPSSGKSSVELMLEQNGISMEFEKGPAGLMPPSRPSTAPPSAIAPFEATEAKEYQETWAKYLGVEVESENSIGMKLSVIPAGTFTMGEDIDAHEVTLTKPFMLGTYEVTQTHYDKVMSVNPSNFKGAKNPVETVSWNDAVEFCRRLSERPAEKAAGNVYRLPTEAEWEFACRAGTTTKYSFGDDELDLRQHAWWNGNSGQRTHPVGMKLPNAFGLFDVHGNVCEWCQDWYESLPRGAVTNPAGAASGSRRVQRGGSWLNPAEYCRSVNRWGIGLGGRSGYMGFRVCLSPSGRQLNASTELAPKGNDANTPPTANSSKPPPANAPFNAAKAKEHQDAWAKYLNVEVETENSIGMRFRVIPAGEFPFYSEKELQSGTPVLNVAINRPFEMAVWETTQDQYLAIMGENPSYHQGPSHPVEQVTMAAAISFCEKLSNRRKEKEAGYVYRLPTAAEWEYACRAGTVTDYHFGSSSSALAKYAWYRSNSGYSTHSVGGKLPNAWGLYDLYGNVYEICSVRLRTKGYSGNGQTVRGGAYASYSQSMRSASTASTSKTQSSRSKGFRVVRVLNQRN